MGMGLFVGIAALGVISFRSVVERRQQIGMLRAIGYQRNMVAASFLIESLVVATLGVLSGTFLAIVLSYNLITSNAFDGTGVRRRSSSPGARSSSSSPPRSSPPQS